MANLRYILPETKVEGKRLGRYVHHDSRSRDYPADTANQLVSVKHKTIGLPLNQGQLGSCTSNALCGALNTQPNYKRDGKVYGELDAVRLYKWETAAEGEPYPPNDPGGSGLMVCKSAQQHYWISGYQHAFGIQHALLALVQRPVITGVSWYTSFDTPDETGMVAITPNATVRGGHEILADEINVADGATINDLDQIIVGFMNSWGRGYGIGGRFYMTAATWATLLNQHGDVTVPIA